MRALIFLVLVFLSGCQTLTKSPPKSFTSDDEFRGWFAFYFRNPDPDRLPFAIKFMERHDYLTRHPDIASIFIAKVMEANPDKITAWFTDLSDSSTNTWNVLLLSVWASNVPSYKKHLETYITKTTPEHQKRIHELTKKNPSEFDVRTIELYDPRQINMLWAAYSVTGDNSYVQRVIDTVKYYTADPEEIESQIGETAIMTLANNTLQYKEVRILCESAEQRHPSRRTRILIRAMLGAVDNIIAEAQKSQNAEGQDENDENGRGIAPAH